MSDSKNGPREIEEIVSPEEEETVARLLRAAGHRPPVPEDHEEVLRSAARFAWRRKVKRRARRAVYLRGGGLLAAAALALLALSPWLFRGPEAPLAVLETVNGAVALAPAAGETEWKSLAEGATVTAGDLVETGDGDARAALRLAGGPSVRLDEGTRLRVVSTAVLALEDGSVYVDSGPGESTERIEIRTPLGTARDIGTQFEVRLSGESDGRRSLAVRVREGLVVLSRDGKSHPAEAGVELTVKPDGTVTEGTVPLDGEAWSWTLEVAPPFVAEGRTPRDLLEWVARERGWRLRFADAAAADHASVVTLSGGSAGIPALDEDTVAMLLLGSGLDYRVEDGAILVKLR